MNQDNQVGYEQGKIRLPFPLTIVEDSEKTQIRKSDVALLIDYSDSIYAGGIRRAREVVEAYDKSGTWNELVILSPRRFAVVMIDDLTKLEEEAKK